MTVALICLFIFGAFGAWRAAKRGGNGWDMAQYAAAHGIPAGLIGMIGMTIAANMGWLG